MRPARVPSPGPRSPRRAAPGLLRAAAVVVAVVWCTLGGAAPPPDAGAHDAPMPGAARHGLLVDEPWVMHHWAPFDERRLEHELRLPPGQLEAFLYDDHHTVAQLARQRGVRFGTLVRRLTSWAAGAPRARRAELVRRTRLMLVSGHLAQHVLHHVFHGAGIEPIVMRRTRVRRARYDVLRDRGWSVRRIVARAGADGDAVLTAVSAGLEDQRRRGVAELQTPPGEAARIADRQDRQLRCWFPRPRQTKDPAAPYGRMYLRHREEHTSADVPTTRRQQAVEERAIARGLAGRPASCWSLPGRFRASPGAPLSRGVLRRLGGVPSGFHGRTNDAGHHDHDM